MKSKHRIRNQINVILKSTQEVDLNDILNTLAWIPTCGGGMGMEIVEGKVIK